MKSRFCVGVFAQRGLQRVLSGHAQEITGQFSFVLSGSSCVAEQRTHIEADASTVTERLVLSGD